MNTGQMLFWTLPHLISCCGCLIVIINIYTLWSLLCLDLYRYWNIFCYLLLSATETCGKLWVFTTKIIETSHIEITLHNSVNYLSIQQYNRLLCCLYKRFVINILLKKKINKNSKQKQNKAFCTCFWSVLISYFSSSHLF